MGFVFILPDCVPFSFYATEYLYICTVVYFEFFYQFRYRSEIDVTSVKHFEVMLTTFVVGSLTTKLKSPVGAKNVDKVSSLTFI